MNQLGERIKPGYLTHAFPDFLENHVLRRIRFHDLRHSCASLLYANGVALKDIAEDTTEGEPNCGAHQEPA